MTTPTDEELMAQACAGDATAFALLVRRHESPLFNYLRRFLQDAADAEDIFQEAFLKVHTHRDRFRHGAPFKPWLYRIATNLAKDRLRYRKRRRMLSIFSAHPSTPEVTLADSLPAPGPGPCAQAAASESAERLEAAVAKLPEKQRAVFLMARYEEMPYAAIAEALDIPEGTVKSRMNTAVKTLLEAMKES